MDNLIKQLEAFVPYNEQEERDLSVMLDLAKSGADVLTRKNKTAHFSASAWIVSPDRKSTLMCFHNIYNSWSWMGGHADGDADLKHVVVKEIGEECGLSPDKLHFLDDGIFSVEILTVNGHEKRGEYVLVVEGASGKENPLCALSETEHILHYMRLGYDKKEALKLAAKDRGVPKSALYPFSVNLHV